MEVGQASQQFGLRVELEVSNVIVANRRGSPESNCPQTLYVKALKFLLKKFSKKQVDGGLIGESTATLCKKSQLIA